MRKVILDFYDVCDELAEQKNSEKENDSPVILADTEENRHADYKELVHAYIADRFGFAESRVKNLDALYDCLTEICEPTVVGFFLPTVEFDDLSIDLMLYLDRVKKVFLEAEADNPEGLAVIMAEGSAWEPEAGDPDEELASLMKDMMKGTVL